LEAVVLQLLLGNCNPDLRRAQLFEDLRDLPGCEIALKGPFPFQQVRGRDL
jgi:hypothetical protein